MINISTCTVDFNFYDDNLRYYWFLMAGMSAKTDTINFGQKLRCTRRERYMYDSLNITFHGVFQLFFLNRFIGTSLVQC